MTYLSKVGSFNIDTSKTAGQTQAITGLGFQPKIVLFWWGGSVSTGDTVAAGTFNIGFGAAISSTSRFCVMGASEDAQAASDTQRAQFNSEVIRAYTDTATLDGIMDFSSMDSDGFTLVVDDQFTQAYRISYLALGGSDLTNVFIGNRAFPGATGNYSVTGVGFRPDVLITATQFFNSTASAGAGMFFMLGMATGSSNEGAIYGYSVDAGATTDTWGYGYTDVTARGDSYHGALVSFDADGFTINHLQGTSVYQYFYICLKGGQYSVGDLTTRTDGNDIAETVGFQPVALLFASANRALSTYDTVSDHLALSIGAGTSASNRACAAVWDEDNLADSETAYANYDSAVYANVKDDAIQGLMDIKSIDANGFTAVMDDADPSACWVTYLAIGALGGTTYYSTPSGALSGVTGGLVKQGRTALAATLTTAGTLVRRTARGLAGTLTTAGTLARRTARGLAGTLTTAGTLARRSGKALTGTVGSAGTLAFRTAKNALVGVLGGAGALTNRTYRTVSGTLSGAGALARRTARGLAGTLVSAGTLVGRANKALAGTIGSAGMLTKWTKWTASGALGSVGTLARAVSRTFTGMLTSAGALAAVRTVLVAVAGTLGSAGTLTKWTKWTASGTLGSVGTLARGVSRTVMGTLGGVGTLTRTLARTVTGTLTSAGSLVAQRMAKTFYQALDGALGTAGVISKRIDRALSGRLW